MNQRLLSPGAWVTYTGCVRPVITGVSRSGGGVAPQVCVLAPPLYAWC